MCGLEVSLLCLVDFCFSPQRDEFHVLSIFLTYFLSSLKIPVRGAIYNAATTSCKTLSKSRRLQLHCLTLAIRIFKFNASRFRHHLFCFCEDGTELTSTEPSRLSVNLLFIINNQEGGELNRDLPSYPRWPSENILQRPSGWEWNWNLWRKVLGESNMKFINIISDLASCPSTLTRCATCLTFKAICCNVH